MHRIFFALILGCLTSAPSPGQGIVGAPAATAPSVAVTPSLFNGQLSVPMELAVPPGRGRTAPNLRLMYRNGARNGLVGVGWTLEPGAIRLKLRATGPVYSYEVAEGATDIEDRLRLKGKGEALRFRWHASETAVTMWDGDGTSYLFGSDDPGASREEMPLSSVVDRFGNRRDYHYVKAAGHDRLACVEYGANSGAGLAHSAHVDFDYETRPDPVRSYGRDGSVLDARLASVQSFSGGGYGAGGDLYAKYAFSYSVSPSTGRSTLTSIIRSGAAGTALPATAFSYESSGFGGWREGVIGLAGPKSVGNPGENCLTLDLNGNGRLDQVCEPTPGIWSVGLKRFDDTAPAVSFVGPPIQADQVSRTCAAADFTGDGKDDLLCNVPTGLAAFESDGRGWLASRRITPADLSLDRCLPGDVDRSGTSDLICSMPNGEVQAFLSSETGWQPVTISRPGVAALDIRANCVAGRFTGDAGVELACNTTGTSWTIVTTLGIGAVFQGPAIARPVANSCLAGDFNGDGLTDLACSSGGKDWKIFASTGTAFVESTWSGGPTATAPLSRSCVTMDINGDGHDDVACMQPDLRTIEVGRSTGIAWQTATTVLSQPVLNSFRQACVFGGFRGRRSTDLACAAAGGTIQAISTPAADNLVGLVNPTGGRTTFEYRPIADVWDLGTSQKLSVAAQDVISAVLVSDGRGGSATTLYDFDEGYFDRATNEFRGFGHVTVRDPANVGGMLIHDYWFLQGDDVVPGSPVGTAGLMRGKPYRVTQSISGSDGTSQILEDQRLTYARDPSLAFNPVSRITVARCETPPCRVVLRRDLTWDRFGNLRSDRSRDPSQARYFDHTTSRTYLRGAPDGPVSLLSSETVTDGIAGRKLSENRFLYGTASTCPAFPAAPPGALALTSVQQIRTGKLPLETGFGYDRLGNQMCRRDPSGALTAFRWDPQGVFQIEASASPGGARSVAWRKVIATGGADGLYGTLKALFDPAATARGSPLATYTYDDVGRLTTLRYDRSSVTLSYLDIGDPAKQRTRVETAGIVSEYLFDGLARNVGQRSTGADGKMVLSGITYDGRGSVDSVSLPYFEGQPVRGNERFEYDGAGRLSRAIHPDGAFEFWCHSDLDTVMGDSLGHRRLEQSDGEGHVASVTEYASLAAGCDVSGEQEYATTRYRTDGLDRLVGIVDANGERTSVTYDDAGRRTEVTDPYAGLRTFSYDDAGNLMEALDGAGHRARYRYDLLRRITDRTAGRSTWTYGYDAGPDVGRLTSVTDANGTLSYGYDAGGRVSRVTRRGSGQPARSLSFAYDDLGRPSTLTYPDASVLTYAYSGSELARVSSGGATLLLRSGFDANGRPTTLQYGTSLRVDSAYGSPGTGGCSRERLLCRTRVSSGGATVLDRTYAWDAAAQLVGVADTQEGATTYGYDPLGRLVSQLRDGRQTTVRYDTVGNIVNLSTIGDYRYDLRSVPAYVPRSIGPRTLDYDAAGHLRGVSDTKAGKRIRSYTYDDEGRVIAASNGGARLTFAYDGEERRAVVTGATSTERLGNAVECVGASCTRTLFAGTTAFAQDGPGGLRFLIQDNIGSTVAVSDGRSVVARPAYGVFGTPTTPPGGVSWLFAGQRYDQVIGLYEMGARLYDPEIGRFVTPDPFPDGGTDPQGRNRFSYALNRPRSLVDATGFRADYGDAGPVTEIRAPQERPSQDGNREPSGGRSPAERAEGIANRVGNRDPSSSGNRRESAPTPARAPGTSLGPTSSDRGSDATRSTGQPASVALSTPFESGALPHIQAGLLTATIGGLSAWGGVAAGACVLSPLAPFVILAGTMAVAAGVAETGLGMAELISASQGNGALMEPAGTRTALLVAGSPTALVGAAVGGSITRSNEGVQIGAAAGLTVETAVTFSTKPSGVVGTLKNMRDLEDYVRSSLDRRAAGDASLP